MTNRAHHSPFNSPLETGVRSLAILVAAHPESFDLERLIEMDYLVVHSGDAGGPDSLHAPLPMRAGELLVRRGLIEKGLLLMMSRHLVKRVPAKEGFNYIADESAAPFLRSLTTSYSQKLSERASWAVERFANESTMDIRRTMRRLFEDRASQFEISNITGDEQ